MKVYRFVRNDKTKQHTLYIEDNKSRTALPIMISGNDGAGGVFFPLMIVAFTILLDYFSNEEHASEKTRLLAKGLFQHLRKLPENSWALTEAELNDAVIRTLVHYRTLVDAAANDCALEYCGGQRRDLLRAQLTA